MNRRLSVYFEPHCSWRRHENVNKNVESIMLLKCATDNIEDKNCKARENRCFYCWTAA